MAFWRSGSSTFPDTQHRGKIMLYIAVTVMALRLLAIVTLARKAPSFRNIYPFAVGFIGFAILPVLGLWGGGV
jgi:hypothetical protein